MKPNTATVNQQTDTYEALLQSRKKALAHFGNIEHRLEFIDHLNGVDYINDSKATDVNSTWYSLESMEQPVIWILGVADADEDYSLFSEIAVDKVKAIICLGDHCDSVTAEFRDRVPNLDRAESIEEAVAISTALADSGDVVLFSPACSGYNLFQNYKDRGAQFRRSVASLRQ